MCGGHIGEVVDSQYNGLPAIRFMASRGLLKRGRWWRELNSCEHRRQRTYSRTSVEMTGRCCRAIRHCMMICACHRHSRLDS